MTDDAQRNFTHKQGVFGILNVVIAAIAEAKAMEKHTIYFALSCSGARVEYFLDERGERPFNHASDIALPQERELLSAACENLQQ